MCSESDSSDIHVAWEVQSSVTLGPLDGMRFLFGPSADASSVGMTPLLLIVGCSLNW